MKQIIRKAAKSILLILFLSQLFTLTFSQGLLTDDELIKAVTTRPWKGENYPLLPALSTEIKGEIIGELRNPLIRSAYEKLVGVARPSDERTARAASPAACRAERRGDGHLHREYRTRRRRLGARASFGPDEPDLGPVRVDLNSIRTMVARLLRDWASSGRVDVGTQNQLLGEILFRAAFPGEIGDRFNELLRTKKERPVLVGLHFQDGTEKTLVTLPWEHLYVPQGEDAAGHVPRAGKLDFPRPLPRGRARLHRLAPAA